MHPARAHLNLPSSPLLPPLTIWPHVRSALILFALAEIIAHLLPPSLWATKEEVASCTRKQTDTCLQGAVRRPHPHPSYILYADCTDVARLDCSLLPATSCFSQLCATFGAVCLCVTSSFVLYLPEVLCAARKWVKNCGETGAICSSSSTSGLCLKGVVHMYMYKHKVGYLRGTSSKCLS